MIVHKQVIFKGHVQGVGFRFTCQLLSEGLGVDGSVENLEDGTVKLVVHGKEEQFKLYLARIQKRMRDNIDETVITDLPAAETPVERPRELHPV